MPKVNGEVQFREFRQVSSSPIFLLGPHKSGTSLLRSLFDGHPDLFVIPKETHLFERSGFWVDYALRRNEPSDLESVKIVAAFVSLIRQYNQASNEQADSITPGLWNEGVFQHVLENAELSDERSIFDAVFQAMHSSLYGIPLESKKRVVEKSVEHAEFALELNAIYPDARFIHIVRNPYANLVSLRRFKTSHKYPFLRSIVRALYNSYYFLIKNQRLVPHYLIVRYEDLVQNPAAIIKKMIDFADLPDHPSLYQSTFMGKPWHGNSVYGMRFSGISDRSLNRWKEEIHPYEVNLLNKVIPAYIWHTFGYERLSEKGNRLVPISGERPKTYLANRLLWYFI